MIGLFELHTLNDNVTWITSRNSPFAYFVRPQAILSHDPELPTSSDPVHIRLLTCEFARMNVFGHIYPEHLTNAFLCRLPYVVSFWEQADTVPVYTVSPDTGLPWVMTIRCAVSLPLLPLLRCDDCEDEVWPVEAEPELLLPADATCPITLDGLVAGGTWRTPCGHLFSVALAQALEADPRCPLCRAACRTDDCTLL